MPSAWFRPPVHNAAPPSLPGVLEGQFSHFSATVGRCDSLRTKHARLLRRVNVGPALCLQGRLPR